MGLVKVEVAGKEDQIGVAAGALYEPQELFRLALSVVLVHIPVVLAIGVPGQDLSD